MVGGSIAPFMLVTPNRSRDPYGDAVKSVQQRFPLLAGVPIAVTNGKGEGFAETYLPWDSDNPERNKLTIQLRDWRGIQGRQLEDAIATESLHLLGSTMPNGAPYNPQWFALKQQLEKALTSEDRELAQATWQRENQQFHESATYESAMQHSILDSLIRGYLFPQNQGEEWIKRSRDPNGWTPQQRAIMEHMRRLLTGGRN